MRVFGAAVKAAIASSLVLGSGVAGLAAQSTAAQAAAPVLTVDLRVLVVDDGSPMVGAIADRLDAHGVLSTRVRLDATDRPTIDGGFLATSTAAGPRAKFSGVVVPSELPAGMSQTERDALTAYETAYSVREVVAYTWANPAVGLNYAADPGYVGEVDGMRGTLTTAAKNADWSYLRGTVPLDDLSPTVAESWGYLATPSTTLPTGSSFTPLLTATIPGTATQGSLLGVFKQGNREQLVSTFASNKYQQHFRMLAPGIVSWVTRGLSTSYNRNYFSAHIDDVFMADARWSITGNCTGGTDCPQDYPDAQTPSRMIAPDVDRLLDWQNTTGIKLDQAFNGAGSDEHVATYGFDRTLSRFKGWGPSQFRWINHTYSHPYLGCVQDYSVTPWRCATDALGTTQFASQTTINAEIVNNRRFATKHGLPLVNSELVTGEHSGLKSAPQMPVDNPNLAPVVNTTGTKWIASDASREWAQRPLGNGLTVPRYPMNIFYNAATIAEEVDEYNWIYTSAADGGSGLCENNPTSTCITPLDPATGFSDYLVPIEARIALGHVLSNDPRPHYAHQSNLTEDRILYPVLDALRARYNEAFSSSAPLINPSHAAAGGVLQDQAAWAANANVVATVSGRTMTITNTGTSSVRVPITAPAGSIWKSTLTPMGELYGGSRSTWRALAAGATVRIDLPTAPGFTLPTTAAGASTTGSATGSATGSTTLSGTARMSVADSGSTAQLAVTDETVPGSPARSTRVVILPQEQAISGGR